jgi:hypothetical protein
MVTRYFVDFYPTRYVTFPHARYVSIVLGLKENRATRIGSWYIGGLGEDISFMESKRQNSIRCESLRQQSHSSHDLFAHR